MLSTGRAASIDAAAFHVPPTLTHLAARHQELTAAAPLRSGTSRSFDDYCAPTPIQQIHTNPSTGGKRSLPPRSVLVTTVRGNSFDRPPILPMTTWTPMTTGDPTVVCRATPEDDVLRRDIFDRPPIFKWTAGRVALLGDSAHAMQPNLGQVGHYMWGT